MLALFREAPLNWLPGMARLLRRIDTPRRIRKICRYAGEKAKLAERESQADQAPQAGSPDRQAAFIGQMFTAYKLIFQPGRRNRARMDTSGLGRKSWKEHCRFAEKNLTLADLLEGGGGRAETAAGAAAKLADLERVAGCLYAGCCEISPALRLAWAERLSVFDSPLELRALEVLPGWEKIADYEQRLDLQRFTDWLFSQVNSRIPQAVSLVNDLVRVCILLAAHAPVSSIINGHIDKPVVGGRIGDFIDVKIDRGMARVGMQVAIYRETAIAVQGIVEDMSAETAVIRVTRSAEPVFNLDPGVIAKFLAGMS
jgi:hypothetical protein